MQPRPRLCSVPCHLTREGHAVSGQPEGSSHGRALPSCGRPLASTRHSTPDLRAPTSSPAPASTPAGPLPPTAHTEPLWPRPRLHTPEHTGCKPTRLGSFSRTLCPSTPGASRPCTAGPSRSCSSLTPSWAVPCPWCPAWPRAITQKLRMADQLQAPSWWQSSHRRPHPWQAPQLCRTFFFLKERCPLVLSHASPWPAAGCRLHTPSSAKWAALLCTPPTGPGVPGTLGGSPAITQTCQPGPATVLRGPPEGPLAVRCCSGHERVMRGRVEMQLGAT